MPKSPQANKPRIIDPDNVPETLCDGRFHVHPHGNMATLTFTMARPKTTDLFDGNIVIEEVVRSRITMTLDNFGALRDLLNLVIITGGDPMPPGGASSDTKH